MPFDEITERVSAKWMPDPCTMRLKRRSNGKPSCIVTLRKALMDELGWKTGGDVALMLGTGEEAGKARLVLKRGGAFTLKLLKNSGQVDLGYVARFGDVPKVAAAARATKIKTRRSSLSCRSGQRSRTITRKTTNRKRSPRRPPRAAARLTRTAATSIRALTMAGQARAPRQRRRSLLRSTIARVGTASVLPLASSRQSVITASRSASPSARPSSSPS